MKIFDQVTELLGEAMRQFASDESFQTRELPSEAQARARRTTREKKKNTPMAAPAPLATPGPPLASSDFATSLAPSARRLKVLNLDTYKYHSLGDVAAAIRRFGTTDSYSTEIVNLQSITAPY